MLADRRRRRWATLTFDRQQRHLKAVIDEVVVAPVKVRGSNRFDPSRITIRWA